MPKTNETRNRCHNVQAEQDDDIQQKYVTPSLHLRMGVRMFILFSCMSSSLFCLYIVLVSMVFGMVHPYIFLRKCFLYLCIQELMNLLQGNKLSPRENFFVNPFGSDVISPNHTCTYIGYRCWSKHMQWSNEEVLLLGSIPNSILYW